MYVSFNQCIYLTVYVDKDTATPSVTYAYAHADTHPFTQPNITKQHSDPYAHTDFQHPIPHTHNTHTHAHAYSHTSTYTNISPPRPHYSTHRPTYTHTQNKHT